MDFFVSLSSVPASSASDKPISLGMFGTNLLFDRDRNSQDPGGGQVSSVFESAIDKLRVTTLRYPGGTISEKLFDLTDPNSANQVTSWAMGNISAFDPDGGGPLTPGTLPLAGALGFASAENVSLTVVLPTYCFLGQVKDQLGHRFEVIDDLAIGSFVSELLTSARSCGVKIGAFELGNEWWADNSGLFNTLMTPTEYGRIASHLARIIDAEIAGFEVRIGSSSDYLKPDIVAQVGPGGNAERYLATGFAAPKGYVGNTVDATDLIFREFERSDERAALSGLVTHRYLTGPQANIDGWKYLPFERFSDLAFSSGDFPNLSRYVSEWNVSARNDDELGSRHAGALVSLFSEMALAGVDHADIWSVQQNNRSRLAQNAGFAGESFGGLTAGGITFRLMRDALPGLKPELVTDNSHDLATYAYGVDGKKVLYIVNTSDCDQTFSLDPRSVLADYQFGWAAVIEPRSEVDPAQSSLADVRIITGSNLISNSKVAYTLHSSEVMQLTLVASQGVAINGTEHSDKIGGSNFDDVLFGGDGNDFIIGSGGRDLLDGGTGSDIIIGGSIDDTFDVVAGQVFRLYKTILGREPDAGGHYENSKLILGNYKSIAQVADDILASPEFHDHFGPSNNGEFVTQLYQSALGRVPADWEVGGWVESLEGGLSRVQVSLGFSESPELYAKTSAEILEFSREGYKMLWSDDVFRLYQTLLNRTPDQLGLVGWASGLANGMPWEDAVYGFMKSSEFSSYFPNLDNQAFVIQLYSNAFHRPPDLEGSRSWLELLNSGALSRAQVVDGFVQSAELRAGSAPKLVDWMHAQGSDDVLTAGQGNDVLFGGMLSDTFIFRAHEQGTNSIVGFEPWDFLCLDGFSYSSTDEAISHMHQVGDDVQFSDQEVQISFTHAHLVDFHDSLVVS